LRRRDRRVDERPGQQLETCRGLRRVRTERTVGELGAVGGERIERRLETFSLRHCILDRVGRRIHRSVVDHGPDLGRELLGVRRADAGAIGIAQIVQLLVSEYRTEDVQVPDHVVGAHMRKVSGTQAFGALLGERSRTVLDVGDAVGRHVDEGLGPFGVALLVGQATDLRRRLADAARVEADQVKIFGDVQTAEEVGLRRDELDRGRSRSTRVYQQRADRVAGRPQPEHRDLCHLPLGVGVVNRNRYGRAVAAVGGIAVQLLVGEVGASAPAHFLAVEPVEVRSRGHTGTERGVGRCARHTFGACGCQQERHQDRHHRDASSRPGRPLIHEPGRPLIHEPGRPLIRAHRHHRATPTRPLRSAAKSVRFRLYHVHVTRSTADTISLSAAECQTGGVIHQPGYPRMRDSRHERDNDVR